MFVIYFFDCNVSSKNLLSSSKNQTTRTFSYKLIIFNSYWSISFPRETAVDIVLDVLENPHSNVNSKLSVKL